MTVAVPHPPQDLVKRGGTAPDYPDLATLIATIVGKSSYN